MSLVKFYERPLLLRRKHPLVATRKDSCSPHVVVLLFPRCKHPSMATGTDDGGYISLLSIHRYPLMAIGANGCRCFLLLPVCGRPSMAIGEDSCSLCTDTHWWQLYGYSPHVGVLLLPVPRHSLMAMALMTTEASHCSPHTVTH